MDTNEKLLAIEEIKFLKGRYFRLMDMKKWDEWELLFTPDVLADFPEDRPNDPPFRNRAEFVDVIKKLHGKCKSIHHGHMPEIEILSPTTARGIWAMQDTMIWTPETATQPGLLKLQGWGHYHETYVKSAEGWRIASVRLTRLDVILS